MTTAWAAHPDSPTPVQIPMPAGFKYGVEYDRVTYFVQHRAAKRCRLRQLQRQYKELRFAAISIYTSCEQVFEDLEACKASKP